jgi:hypothetical protein
MVVCEADISPYRRAYQQRAIEYGLLSDDLFSRSQDYFDDMEGPDLFSASAADTMTIKVVFAFLGNVPELTVTPTWIAIRHQAGGYACEQHRFIATELNARQNLLERLRQIARALGSSHFWLTKIRAWTCQPLRSIPITGTSSLLRTDPPLSAASAFPASWVLHLRLFPWHRQIGSQVPWLCRDFRDGRMAGLRWRGTALI